MIITTVQHEKDGKVVAVKHLSATAREIVIFAVKSQVRAMQESPQDLDVEAFMITAYEELIYVLTPEDDF